MTSAGNDIVSLTAINVTRTKGPEFYSKIISESEKELFAGLDGDALLFEHYVWLLWSVKEAAFKYLHRLDPETVFTPVKFVVSGLEVPKTAAISGFEAQEMIANGFEGLLVWNSVVSFKGHTLYAKTIIHLELISSVVNHSKNFSDVFWGIKRVEDTGYKFQSAAVRQFAIRHLQEILSLSQLTIGKNQDEVPVLLSDNVDTGVPISLSHHGNWIGYSFYNDNSK
jgi:phosphopantetheinyl transferase (holo-ACP synthase)